MIKPIREVLAYRSVYANSSRFTGHREFICDYRDSVPTCPHFGDAFSDDIKSLRVQVVFFGGIKRLWWHSKMVRVDVEYGLDADAIQLYHYDAHMPEHMQIRIEADIRRLVALENAQKGRSEPQDGASAPKPNSECTCAKTAQENEG